MDEKEIRLLYYPRNSREAADEMLDCGAEAE